ncbi:leukocyte receptor cluster member 9 isoform X1 [Electrophorus electricus]|uniref:leukocyte receptor cluster member 9 isoform X1 n=1 Tax=Electrophorus electricus TaxID=8005 RepID=UPI0015CF892C|nr:leukocyte receptor cluster member 9 isoform X1 [Electrophorus electricus]
MEGCESSGKSFAEEWDTLAQAQTEPDVAAKDPTEPDVCKYFLMGRCHFGDRCRLSHSSLSADVVCNTRQAKDKGSRNQRTRKKSNKTEKAKGNETKEVDKKPRMRTADDVISRILWDSSVDPGDFVVGHLDRFLGVLERPFSDFSWDTQVCDCDYSEEMAIPRHRIQYFSYKGQCVWDRESRTDRVFGSTGQTVVPPFDMEDLLLENTELEVEESSSEKTELGESVESDTTAIVEDGPLSVAGDTTNGEKAKDAGYSGLTQEAEGLSISPRNEPPAAEEERKDAWDEEEEAKVLAAAVPPGPLPGRVPRKPTHFVCFRVDSPAALLAFQRVQRKVLTHLPQSEPFWVSPATLHVTLTLLVLHDPAEVYAAGELLRFIIRGRYKPPISVSFTPKLKHFNGKVLHLLPQPKSDIQGLNAPLQQAFRERGWLHRHSRDPTYHLTLAKVEGEGVCRMFEEVGTIKFAKDVNFGKLEVDKLYLCVNNTPKTESGFYETVCAVQLPTV